MKIIMILTNGFDPDVRVFKEAKFLVDSGIDVEIICWDRKCEYIDKIEENIEGVMIKRFAIKSVPGTGMRQLIPFLKYISSVKKYLKKQKYNYLHCHDFDGILTGYIATKFKKRKLIFDMHEIYSNKFKIFVKFFAKKATNVIYVNEEQLKFLGIDKNNKKIIYLPNYPLERDYLPIEKENSEKTRINYIGFLRDYESLKKLIEIAKNNSKIEVGFYGSGKCYEQIEKEEKTDNVIIYGKFDGINESAKIYRNTDILYCVYNPQIYNWKTAYPVKMYEGIITKTPIIVSKYTKAAEFIEKYKIGECVEYDNIDELKNVIEKIEKNYNDYIKNIEKIKSEYNWESVVRKLTQIYNGEENNESKNVIG